MSARVGKIARLPVAIRDELNRRLLDGQPASKILPWLNGLEAVQKILEEDHEGLRVTDQNLSDWRRGGYADWLRRRENVERTRELSKFSMEMAKASGGNLTEGAAAILSGKILDVLETLENVTREINEMPAGDGLPSRADELLKLSQTLDSLTDSLSSLRAGDHSKQKLTQNQEKLAIMSQQLEIELARLRQQTAKYFMNLRADEREALNAIADSSLSNEDKLEQLGQKLFPLHWKPKSERGL